MGYMEEWSAVIRVDSATAISFQPATKMNTKVNGVCNLRDIWAHELCDDTNIATGEVPTTLKLPDALTKCLTATVTTKLLTQPGRLVVGFRGSYARYSRGAREAGALPGMNTGDERTLHRRWWLAVTKGQAAQICGALRSDSAYPRAQAPAWTAVRLYGECHGPSLPAMCIRQRHEHESAFIQRAFRCCDRTVNLLLERSNCRCPYNSSVTSQGQGRCGLPAPQSLLPVPSSEQQSVPTLYRL